MGNMIRQFFAWLFSGSRPSPTTYGNPDLHPIDTERLAKDLDLERQAERLGKQDIPRPDDRTLTGIEAKIVQVIEKARQEYADWGSQRERLLNETINKTDISPSALRALQLDDEFERKTGSRLNASSSTLNQLKGEIQERNKEFDIFQKNHGLIGRAAKTPSDWEKVFRQTILAVLIIVEGSLNSVFFAQGMWGGLLDGLFYALLFAFINIALAYCYGRFFVPQLFHRHIAHKIIGAVLCLFAITMIITIALLIAHYRDAVSAGSYEAAARIAWNTFRDNPFDLKDIQSVLLCLVSIGFAIASMFDAFGLDDPYPGYGNVTKHRNQVIDDHANELELVRQQLEDSKGDTLQELDKLIDDMRVALLQFDQAIAQKSETGAKLTRAFTNVDNCLDALLHQFRNTNTMHRKAPPPAYFFEHVIPRPVTRSDFNVIADQEKYASQRRQLQEVESNAPRIRANIQSSYSRFFDRLKSLDEHFSPASQPNT